MNKIKDEDGFESSDKNFRNQIIEDGEDEGFEFNIDLDDALVQTIDGVLIKADDEEVRMLFYHHKPDGVDYEDEIIKCRGIAEFRTTKKTFNYMIKYLNSNWNSILRSNKKNDSRFHQERLPMFG